MTRPIASLCKAKILNPIMASSDTLDPSNTMSSELLDCDSDLESDAGSFSWSDCNASTLSDEIDHDMAITCQSNRELRKRDAVKGFFEKLEGIRSRSLNDETREWFGTLPTRMSTEAIPLFRDDSTGADYQLHPSFTSMRSLHTAGSMEAAKIDPYLYGLLHCGESGDCDLSTWPKLVIPVGKLFVNRSGCSKWTGYEFFVSDELELWIIYTRNEDDPERAGCVRCNLVRPTGANSEQGANEEDAPTVSRVARVCSFLRDIQSLSFEEAKARVHRSSDRFSGGSLILLELSKDQFVNMQSTLHAHTTLTDWPHDFRNWLKMGEQYIHPTDDAGEELLGLANENPDAAIMELVVRCTEEDLNDPWERNLLSRATIAGNKPIIELLLNRRNSKVNSICPGEGVSPLIYAVEEGHDSIVELFLEQMFIDVNCQSVYGDTALMCAVRTGNEKIVRLLLGHSDIQVNLSNNHYDTALMLAAQHGNAAIVELLLKCEGIRVNTRAKHFETALIYAAYNGHESIVRHLLENKTIKVNKTAECHGTALMSAARKGHESIVKLLLERSDIEVNRRDWGGDTALSEASYGNHESIVRLLVAHRDIDLNAETKSGHTALSLAMSRGHNQIARILRECKAQQCPRESEERAVSKPAPDREERWPWEWEDLYASDLSDE